MESDEIETASKSGMNIRNDKNTVIDYDEDRVRLEFISCAVLSIYECVCAILYKVLLLVLFYILYISLKYIYV